MSKERAQDQPQRSSDRDERVSLPLDPEEALRGLLNTGTGARDMTTLGQRELERAQQDAISALREELAKDQPNPKRVAALADVAQRFGVPSRQVERVLHGH